MATNNNIRIEHGVLAFRNFAGAKKVNKGQILNEEGKRNFCVYLDGFDRKGNMFKDERRIPRYKYGPDWMSPNELIEALERDKWHVGWTKPSEDGEYPSRPFIKVHVKFNSNYPQFNPKALMVKDDGGFTNYDEDMIGQFDTTWIDNADLIIKPFNYEERKGIENGHVSAELKIIYITPVRDLDEDDDFDGKYSRPGFNDEEPLPF